MKNQPRHLNRQLIENLRYGINYSRGNLHLKLQTINKSPNIIAHVENENHSFVYESYALSRQEGLITPFSAFPFVRKIRTIEESSWIKTIDWNLPPNPDGMLSFRFKEKRVDSIEEIHLYSYLCSALSLSSLKKITKVWYSDRYLLRVAENICFLLLLEDMPLLPLAEIHLAVNGERSSYNEFAFQEREDQKKFLDKTNGNVGFTVTYFKNECYY